MNKKKGIIELDSPSQLMPYLIGDGITCFIKRFHPGGNYLKSDDPHLTCSWLMLKKNRFLPCKEKNPRHFSPDYV